MAFRQKNIGTQIKIKYIIVFLARKPGQKGPQNHSKFKTHYRYLQPSETAENWSKI